MKVVTATLYILTAGILLSHSNACSVVEQMFPSRTKRKAPVTPPMPKPVPPEVGILPTFVLKPVPATSIDQVNGQLAQILDDERFVIMGTNGTSWEITNKTWVVNTKEAIIDVQEPDVNFQLLSEKVWVFKNKQVTFGTLDVINGTFSGPTITLPIQSTTPQIVGADDTHFFVGDETSDKRTLLRITKTTDTTLTLQTYNMTSMIDGNEGAWSAGNIDNEWLWIWTKKKLRVVSQDDSNAASIDLYQNPIFLENQSDEIIRHLTMRVSKVDDSIAISGPVLALVGEDQMFVSGNAASEYQWPDIQARLQQFCIPCHPAYSDQAIFMAAKGAAIGRITSSNASLVMPPNGSAQSDNITALDRQILVDWLQQ